MATLMLARIPVTSARAQVVVVDPANLYQTVLIAERTWQHYQELRRQIETLQRMARGLGDMHGFRIATIAITGHDPGRWSYGRPWIQALNTGDADGSAYLSTTMPLLRPSHTPERLTSAARRMFERQYATVEIADSVAMMGGHQVALSRGYHRRLQSAVEALDEDVRNPQPRYHEMTAILDKIAVGELGMPPSPRSRISCSTVTRVVVEESSGVGIALEQTVQALKNVIEGYGDRYIVPTHGLLDDLAEGFGHTEAGQKLKILCIWARSGSLRETPQRGHQKVARFKTPRVGVRCRLRSIGHGHAGVSTVRQESLSETSNRELFLREIVAVVRHRSNPLEPGAGAHGDRNTTLR